MNPPKLTKIKDVIKFLKSKGWEIEHGRKHIKAKHPKGGFISMSVSPSCQFAAFNAMKDAQKLENQHEQMGHIATVG